MVIFNSYVTNYQRVSIHSHPLKNHQNDSGYHPGTPNPRLYDIYEEAVKTAGETPGDFSSLDGEFSKISMVNSMNLEWFGDFFRKIHL